MKERLKKLRKALDLTQQEFADRIGISRGNIATYETRDGNPGNSVINLICREFNVNETWLRTGEGEMLAPEPAFDLGGYAQRHGMTVLETEVLKAYLDLDPDLRDKLLKHFKERLAKPTTLASPEQAGIDISGQERAQSDVAARVEELERQNKELAAKIAAMEEEDARMEAAAELSPGKPFSGDTKTG